MALRRASILPNGPEERGRPRDRMKSIVKRFAKLAIGWLNGGSNMKAFLCLVTFAMLVSTPVLSADSVSLVGTWAGQRDRIAKDEGRRGGLATLVITDQQGNTFTGHLKRSNPTGDVDEPLWGAFTPEAKLMMGSDEEGTYIFSLIDHDTLDYCYSEAGPTARSVCARLVRQP
jgi:hypothetical protein